MQSVTTSQESHTEQTVSALSTVRGLVLTPPLSLVGAMGQSWPSDLSLLAEGSEELGCPLSLLHCWSNIQTGSQSEGSPSPSACEGEEVCLGQVKFLRSGLAWFGYAHSSF